MVTFKAMELYSLGRSERGIGEKDTTYPSTIISVPFPCGGFHSNVMLVANELSYFPVIPKSVGGRGAIKTIIKVSDLFLS